MRNMFYEERIEKGRESESRNAMLINNVVLVAKYPRAREAIKLLRFGASQKDYNRYLKDK